MSVLEEIRSLEKQVLTRLRELEPSLAEYRELRQVAERLGLKYDANGASETAAPRRPRRATQQRAATTRNRARSKPTKSAKRGKRHASVSPGMRDQQVLEAVSKKPGITVPELGKVLGIDYTGLYRVTRRLETAGRLRKTGPRLELQDGSS